MKFLKPGEAKREVKLETEVTLAEVLKRLGEDYVEGAIYRAANGPLDLDDMVSDSDLIITAQAESNG